MLTGKNALDAWRQVCQAIDVNELDKILKGWETIEESQTSHITNRMVEEIRKSVDAIKGFIKGKEEEERTLGKNYQKYVSDIKMQFLPLIHAEYDTHPDDASFEEWMERGETISGINFKNA